MRLNQGSEAKIGCTCNVATVSDGDILRGKLGVLFGLGACYHKLCRRSGLAPVGRPEMRCHGPSALRAALTPRAPAIYSAQPACPTERPSVGSGQALGPPLCTPDEVDRTRGPGLNRCARLGLGTDALAGCFRNGLGLVKSPVSRVAGFMLPSVIGARPSHHAIQVNSERLSEERAVRPRTCHEQPAGVIGVRVPATGLRRASHPAPARM